MAKTTAPRRKAKSPRRADSERAAWDAILPDLEKLRQLDLPDSDGMPMESDYHVMQLYLLLDVVHQHLGAPRDYFCSGNMFIYYSVDQAVEISDYVNERSDKRPRYKGPDFFLVKGVDGTKERRKWIVWEEDGRYPDLIVEIVSPSTKEKDLNENKELYAKVFHTPEYFWYDSWTGELGGYKLVGRNYEPIPPNERGWLWSEVLGAWVGLWKGAYRGRTYPWLRLYDAEGNLLLTGDERAAQERQRAEQAEARLQQLRALLAERGIELDDSGGNNDEAQL